MTNHEDKSQSNVTSAKTEAHPRRAYQAPRIEKRRSVARVTLLSGMGQVGMGVVGNMM